MSLRACIYKDCGNYINLKDRSFNKDVKLFSFPKNPQRRQKWIEYGKVPSNVPASMYYFCSDHFDKKFFAINNVRTVLVGEAVPYPYVEREIDTETYEEDTSSNLDYFLYDTNRDSDMIDKQQLQNEQDLHVESTTMPNEFQDEFHEEHYSINLAEEKTDECIIFTEENNTQLSLTNASSNKRKMDDTNTNIQIEASSSNAKLLKTSPLQKPLKKSFEKTNATISQQTPTATNSIARETIEEIDPDQLINAERVTTFIFKGEEYVQMSKDHYINEKMDLIKKLRKMEHTLKTIKQHLNSLDF